LAKKQDRSQIIRFQEDTRGMSFAQKREYMMMSESKKSKYLKSLNIITQEEINKEKEKEEKLVEKDIPVKLTEKGHVRVPVLNMRGKPLMPTSPKKARSLLKAGKAKVIQRCPFIIQLKYATGENKQPIKLALDPGYKNTGFSVITDKRELISGEVTLRADVKEKIAEKKMYRTNRRSRNTRYREARWKNRGNKKGKKKGWLAPSIEHKLGSNIRLIDKLSHILPITSVRVEIASFDTQKMQNPEISGIEYQQGELQGYEVREYLLEKWGRKCAYCKVESVPFEVEHIIPPKRGGTDRVSNLTIACHKCNRDKDIMTAAEFGHPEIHMLAKKPLKAAAYMNIVRSKLVDRIKKEFPNYYCDSTYGYITKCNRINMGLEKTHANDAFVIAGGVNQIRSKPYKVIQIRRNNRSLQLNKKGSKPSIRRNMYKYSPGDLVKRVSLLQTTGWGEGVGKKVGSTVYIVKGMFNYGERIRLKNPIAEEDDININASDVKICKYGSGLLFGLAKSGNNIENGNNTEKKDKVDKKDKVKKLSKKEQKIIDMKPQRGIDGGEMIIVEKKKSKKTDKKDKVDKKLSKKEQNIEDAWN
jgi:5-methylcytosine-specific restriction endonuclease McrA